MRLFHAPGTCSLGIRILLEEAGAPYDLSVLDLSKGAQRDPAYLAVNPKGKVPALQRDDGSLLTEFPAIALWIARQYPDAGLWPSDREGEVRTLELLENLVGTVHMRGFTLALMPMKFVPGPEAQQALREHGLAVAREGLARTAEALGEQPFLNGTRPGAADAVLFYLLLWAQRLEIPLAGTLTAFRERMMARDTVRRALDMPAA